MHIKKIVYSFILICLIFNVNVFGQVTRSDGSKLNTITTAVPLLMIGPDARAGAMGDAGVSSTPDVSSMHWNPSKYAFIEKDMGVGISYTPWLKNLVPDINLGYISGFKRLDKKQTIAFSLLYFSLGDITFTNETGENIGTFRPNEYSVDFVYTRKLSKHFSGGVSLRYINSNLTGNRFVSGASTHPGRAVATDVSGYYRKDLFINKRKALFAFGFNFSNIGNKISYTETTSRDFLPMNLRFGPSLKFDLDEYNSLEIMVDVNKLLVPTPPIYYQKDSTYADGRVVKAGQVEKGQDPRTTSIASAIFTSFYDAPGGFKEEFHEYNYSVGIEYWYDKRFALRGGYFYEHPTKGNRRYFTLGLGLKYNVFNLDFSYLIATDPRTNPLTNTLRFTMIFDFDSFKDQNKKEAKN